MPQRSVRWWLWWAISLLSLAALALAACQPQPPLETYGELPPFTLVDQAGTPFGSQDLGGRVVLMDFIYTNCTDVCPMLTAKMNQVQNRLKEQGLLGSRVALVSVSVDPMHDTPPVLAEYAGRFGVDGQAWKFLTGDWDQVYDLLSELKLQPRVPRPAADAPAFGGTELLHTSRLVLVDGQGLVRGLLRGDDTSPDEIVQTIKRALG